MDDVARSSAWFPAVGLLLGAIVLAVDRLTMRALPPNAVDMVLVVATVVLTGALHLDGLADVADGLFGGRDPARRLEIMHDVHTGTFGVVAVVCVLALKWAGYNALPSDVRVEGILLAPCAARMATLTAIAAFPYARAEGVGAGFRGHAWPFAWTFGAATMVVAAIALLGWPGLLVAAFSAASALVLGALAARLLGGGLTGDVYGAILEVTEACALLFIAAMAQRGWLDAWLLR
jgi:adenosylcobinamide-GDP ribazoletransferase